MLSGKRYTVRNLVDRNKAPILSRKQAMGRDNGPEGMETCRVRNRNG